VGGDHVNKSQACSIETSQTHILVLGRPPLAANVHESFEIGAPIPRVTQLPTLTVCTASSETKLHVNCVESICRRR
jgi:hypothetical protein